MTIVFILAIICEKNYSGNYYGENDIRKFEKVLSEKEEKAEIVLRDIQGCLVKGDEFVLNRMIIKNADLYKNEGIAIFVYHNDSLAHWTTNELPVPVKVSLFPDDDIIRLNNFICLKSESVSGYYTFISLILIRSEYPYENKILKEGFQKRFKLSKNVNIISPGVNPVYSRNGKILFSLDFTAAKKENNLKYALCVSLYFLTFILFLIFLNKVIKFSPLKRKNFVFFCITLILFGFYFLVQFYHIPGIIFKMELFSPHKFAHSSFLSSLGNLLLLTVIVFFIFYNFYLEFSFNIFRLKSHTGYRVVFFTVLGFIVLALFYIHIYIFRSLVLDSSISFETYKVLEISVYTFIGFLINALIFVSYALLLDRIFAVFLKLNLQWEALIFLICISFLTLSFFIFQVIEIFPESVVFFLLVATLIYYNKIKGISDIAFPLT